MKTQETLDVEYFLVKNVAKKGTYGCKEVTLRHTAYDHEIERVDYVTFNNYGEIRCYEIKVSKSDLMSSNRMSYWGDFNYLVLTKKLFDKLNKLDTKNNPLTQFYWRGIGVITIDLPSGKVEHVRRASKKEVSLTGRMQVLESIAKSACKQVENYCYLKEKNNDKSKEKKEKK